MRALALALLLLAAPLAAQEPTPDPTLPLPPLLDMAPAPDAPAAITEATVVENADGSPLAVVPAPAEASRAEVAAVAENSAETIAAVANNEVSLEEATRNPINSLDLGDNTGTFLALASIFGLLFGPLVSIAVEKASAIDSRLGAFISVASGVVFFVLMYFLLHERYPNLPQELLAWVWTGLGASALGIGAKSGYRSWEGRGAAASTATPSVK